MPSDTSGQIHIETIGIVGSGAMGRGIAQIAALAGLKVRLFDSNAAAVGAARDYLAETFAKLTAKGKLDEFRSRAALSAVSGAQALAEFADCDLVVEAIVEKLDAKQRAVPRARRRMVSGRCVLATNTSSLSVTAIAAGCTTPARVAGFHFFNPVPLMKVVEVIAGLRTDRRRARAADGHRAPHGPYAGAREGHARLHRQPRGARLRHRGAAHPGRRRRGLRDIDRILRDQAGFRLGPFELLDLTALDVSHPVMESIYRQYYEEPRFRPSPITAQRLAGGLLGPQDRRRLLPLRGRQAAALPNRRCRPLCPARAGSGRAAPHATSRRSDRLRSAGATLDSGATPGRDSLCLGAAAGPRRDQSGRRRTSGPGAHRGARPAVPIDGAPPHADDHAGHQAPPSATRHTRCSPPMARRSP